MAVGLLGLGVAAYSWRGWSTTPDGQASDGARFSATDTTGVTSWPSESDTPRPAVPEGRQSGTEDLAEVDGTIDAGATVDGRKGDGTTTEGGTSGTPKGGSGLRTAKKKNDGTTKKKGTSGTSKSDESKKKPSCTVQQRNLVQYPLAEKQASIKVAECSNLVPGKKYEFELTYHAELINPPLYKHFKARVSLRVCWSDNGGCAFEASSIQNIRTGGKTNYLESAPNEIPMGVSSDVIYAVKFSQGEEITGNQRDFYVTPTNVSVTELSSTTNP